MKPHGDKERTNDRKGDGKNGKNYFSGSTGQWDILKTQVFVATPTNVTTFEAVW